MLSSFDSCRLCDVLIGFLLGVVCHMLFLALRARKGSTEPVMSKDSEQGLCQLFSNGPPDDQCQAGLRVIDQVHHHPSTCTSSRS